MVDNGSRSGVGGVPGISPADAPQGKGLRCPAAGHFFGQESDDGAMLLLLAQGLRFIDSFLGRRFGGDAGWHRATVVWHRRSQGPICIFFFVSSGCSVLCVETAVPLFSLDVFRVCGLGLSSCNSLWLWNERGKLLKKKKSTRDFFSPYLYEADKHQPSLLDNRYKEEIGEDREAMGGGTGRGRGDRQAEPLLRKLSESSSDNSSEEHPVKRTGTVWTAMAHVITAVIGSGVLSLAWSVAQLGWVGGPAAMVLFAGVTVVQSSLLADCYISHDTERGAAVRNRSYVDAVRLYLGQKSQMLSGFFLGFSLFGNSVVYTLTSAASMRAIERANCYHREGQGAPCCAAAAGGSSEAYYMLLFGLAQVALSQIPDFHSMAWLSVFAAAMSFSYSFIGFGLGAAKVIENGAIKGAIGGVSLVSPRQKVWRVAQALGDIAFAYPFSLVLLEIEDTLRSPPAESKTMKTASRASIAVTTFFYLGCGCFGYAAFGDGTPGNLLTGFGEPYWLVGLANLCVVLHLLGGYQVYAQPMFALVERRFGAGVVDAEMPLVGRVSVSRLCFRTANVAAATAVAVWFPYFNQVVGLIGAFTFWPLAIHFPVQMYLAQGKVAPWTGRWLAIQAFSAGCLVACGFASVGSAMGVFSPERS